MSCKVVFEHNRSDLPEAKNQLESTFRSMTLDGIEHDFTDGFVDLHKACYSEILSGRGFGIADARPSIELAWRSENLQFQVLQMMLIRCCFRRKTAHEIRWHQGRILSRHFPY